MNNMGGGIFSGMWQAIAQSVGYGSQSLNPILLNATGVTAVQNQQALSINQQNAQAALDAQALKDATNTRIIIIVVFIAITGLIAYAIIKRK